MPTKGLKCRECVCAGGGGGGGVEAEEDSLCWIL